MKIKKILNQNAVLVDDHGEGKIANGIVVRNKLLSEIEILYSEEFAIAQ